MKTQFALILTIAGISTVPVFAADQPSAPPPAPKTVTATASATAVVTAPDATTNEVVARVNGVDIKRKELDMAVEALQMQLARRGGLPESAIPQAQRDMLEQLISRQLVLAEAQAHPSTGVDEKFKEAVTQMMMKVGGEESFEKALTENHVSKDEYMKRMREEVMVQQTIQQMVEKQVEIKPEEIKSYYASNPTRFQVPEAVHASHILIQVPAGATPEQKVAKRTQIDAARSLVKNGDAFADVAKKVSEDPGSGPRGGDLGFFRKGQMVPEFESVAFSIPTNQVSDVVTTQFGYHIILVTERKPASTRTLDESKKDIEGFLRYQRSGKVVDEYVKGLHNKAKIEVLMKLPEPTAAQPAPAAAGKPTVVVETPPVAAPSK